MRHWILMGALALVAPAVATAEQMHGAGLELNAEQMAALGLKFAPLEPVVQVEGYAWPAMVDIPLAHRDMLAAPVSARVKQIHVVHGEVKAGQALMVLESAELVGLQQAYLDALAQLKEARRNFDRAQRLRKAGSLSEKQYLAALTALKTAQNAKAAAYEALIYAGLSLQQIRSLAAGGEPVREVVLRSPKDGLLFDLRVERNQRVEAGAPLAQIGEIAEVVVDVNLPVEVAGKVRLGQAVAVAGASMTGKVAYIARQADPETQRVTVHALFDNAERRLLPGQFVRVHLLEGAPAPNAFRVPSSAVVDLDGVPSVFLREGGHIEPKPVELVDRDGRWAIVALAERPDERMQVVSFGAIFLKGMMESEGEDGEGAGHGH